MTTSDNQPVYRDAELFDLLVPIARKLHAHVRPIIDLDDLVAEGAIGLLRAAERFDPERGIRFAPFARIYVRGAMLDALRRWSPVPRQGQRRPRCVCGFPIEQADETNWIDRTESRIDAQELLQALPSRWRTLIELHKLQHKPLKEAGAVLGISEARASQLLAQAMHALRKHAA